MYLDFYGLKEKPFNLTPDPRFLYLSGYHRGALEHVFYGLKQKEGFILITGDVGTGKTTLCRAILERLDKETKTALILNPMLSEEELVQNILEDFGIIPKNLRANKKLTKKNLIDILNSFLLKQLSIGGNAVLIIDEAQNLSLPVLEQIRILSNLETDKEKLLQIVLVGQQELKQKLELPELRQLNQRISIRYHLYPLTKEETQRYTDHRLMVAGANRAITFSKGALDIIFKYSQGVPRLINLICDRALLGGYTEQTFHISKEIVMKGVASLGGYDIKSSPGLSSRIKSLFKLNLLLIALVSLLVLDQTRPSPLLRAIPELPLHKFGKQKGKEISTLQYKIKDLIHLSKLWKSNPESISQISQDNQPPTLTLPHERGGEKMKVEKPYQEKPGDNAFQLYAFQSNYLALKKAQQLKLLGYEVYYIDESKILGKGLWNKILVGKFKDKTLTQATAEDLVKMLEGLFYVKIVKIPPP